MSSSTASLNSEPRSLTYSPVQDALAQCSPKQPRHLEIDACPLDLCYTIREFQRDNQPLTAFLIAGKPRDSLLILQQCQEIENILEGLNQDVLPTTSEHNEKDWYPYPVTLELDTDDNEPSCDSLQSITAITRKSKTIHYCPQRRTKVHNKIIIDGPKKNEK